MLLIVTPTTETAWHDKWFHTLQLHVTKLSESTAFLQKVITSSWGQIHASQRNNLHNFISVLKSLEKCESHLVVQCRILVLRTLTGLMEFLELRHCWMLASLQCIKHAIRLKHHLTACKTLLSGPSSFGFLHILKQWQSNSLYFNHICS